MRRLIALGIFGGFLFFSLIILAQVPRLLNYQGRLTDDVGSPITTTTIIRFSLYQGGDAATPGSGTLCYQEDASVTPDGNGVFDHLIGSGTVIFGALDATVFQTAEPVFLEITIDPAGANETLLPRKQIVTVGYSFKSELADDADTVDGQHASAFAPVVHHHDADYVNEGQADSVNSSMIVDDTIVDADINAGANIAGSKINPTGLDADTVDGQHASAFAPSVHSHDDEYVNVDEADSVTSSMIVDGTIVDADINAGANIAGSKIDPTGLNADLLDGKDSEEFVHTAGDDMTGTLSVITTGAAYSIYGKDENTTGTTYGVFGQSDSSNGRGIFGLATATTGTNRGIYGKSVSTEGYGVYGWASATSGTNYGLHGRSDSTDGYGVYGEAPYTGVYGLAYATVGNNSGVRGQSKSASGRGVYGWASATNGNNSGVWGQSNSTSGYGVYGWASAASGTTYGLHGQSDSTDGYGVYGTAPTYGVYGLASSTSGTNVGVEGISNSSSGYGVYGYAGNISGTNYGVMGESASTSGRGVVGYASNYIGTNYGVYGETNSSSGYAIFGIGGAYAGYFSGNAHVTGDFTVGGSKTCVQPIDNGKKVLLYAMESPEIWFEDFGTAQLVNGQAVVRIESIFAQTANTEAGYMVFLTPIGEWKGLYIFRKDKDSFEVREQGGGTSNISFDYRIVAKRRGYEEVRFEEFTEPERPPTESNLPVEKK